MRDARATARTDLNPNGCRATAASTFTSAALKPFT
jgi:hypothetical protein